MTNQNTRDSYIFYRSFYEAIKELPKENQLEIYNAIAEYSLNFKEVELSGLSKTIFTLIKPQLEANNKKYLNGSKPKQKQKISKTEAKNKQKISKTEGNVNVNEECIMKNENVLNVEELWIEYKPLHTSKGVKNKSLGIFKKLLSKNKFEDILQGTKNYIKNCHTKNIYTKQAERFLKDEIWKEYLENSTESNREQHTVDLINKMMNDTLINKIEVTHSNKAKLFMTKDNFYKYNSFSNDLKEKILNSLKNELGVNGLEYNF
jgi:hypothetical protein